MATIRKRNRKWHVQIRRKDHPTLTRSFDMRKHACAWAREEESKLDRIQAWQSPVSMHRLTLADLVRRYRNEEVPKKRGAERETTMLDAFLRTELCRTPLPQIRPGQFATYRDERLRRVRPATICRELGIYQHMFGVAIKEWGLPFATNPLAEVRKPKRDDRTPRRIPNSIVVRLEQAAVRGRTPLVVPLVRFALETAMRRGELLALQWNDINLETQLLHIPKTKNGCPRTIPLTPVATAILLSLDRTEEGSHVFPITRSALSQCWRRLIRRAELKDVRFHDLRHEAISRFFELGLSMPEVALISGHKDHRMLMHYTHLKPQKVGEKLAQLHKRLVSQSGREVVVPERFRWMLHDAYSEIALANGNGTKERGTPSGIQYRRDVDEGLRRKFGVPLSSGLRELVSTARQKGLSPDYCVTLIARNFQFPQ